MKLDKAVSCLWGIGLSFLVSFGAVGCIVTAFDMDVALGQAAFWCALAALVCSVCFTLPLKLVPPGLGALMLGYLWQKGSFIDSLEALLNRLTRQYNMAYGWGIIRWGFRTADDMEPTMILILCVLGAATAMAVAWAVCRRKTAIPGVVLSLLPVAACFVVTDTVPDVLWLYLWLLGVLVLLLTGRVRCQEEKQGNRLCALASPCAALALLVLFAAVPQSGYHGQNRAEKLVSAVLGSDPVQLFMGYTQGNSVLSVDSNAVDLRNVGYRMETKTKIMEVTAQLDGTLYLRGRAMDTYNGVSWSDSGNAAIKALSWPEEGLGDAVEVTVTTRYAHRMLYTPYYIDAELLQTAAVGIENEEKLTKYTYSCSIAPATGLSDEEWYDQDSLDRCIRLDERVAKWAKPLAGKLTSGMTGIYQKATTIASYVRNCATYDTSTPRMPTRDRDFARWFLEESNTGYCVHFATATAVLLQAAGIPARYVTGYTVQAQAGQTVAVGADQAHAWVEYWLPGFGWTVLEATPPDLRVPPEQTEATKATDATDATGQTLPDTTEATAVLTPDTSSEAPWADAVLTALAILAAAALLTALCEGQRSLRRSLRQKKRSRGSENDQALIRWQETVRLARLLGEPPDKALFQLTQKAKYSQYTLTRQELARFDSYAAEAVGRLKKRSVFHRFYYRVILAVY